MLSKAGEAAEPPSPAAVSSEQPRDASSGHEHDHRHGSGDR